MVNNCLVTKLKSVVNNSTLVKLGVIELSVDASGNSDSFVVSPANGKTVNVSVIGNGAIALSSQGLINDPKTQITVTDPTTIFCKKEEDYTISIKQKYDLATLNLSTDNTFISIANGLNTLSYCNNLGRLTVSKTTTGDISCLKDCAALYYIFINRNNNITGNISSIAHLPITTFDIDHATLISGTVEGFVEAAIENNISRDTSNAMYVNFSETRVTWGGSSLGAYFVGKFIWSKVNNVYKIACFKDISSSASTSDATTVWCSGYGTQEQAEAAFPGKTVVRVDA